MYMHARVLIDHCLATKVFISKLPVTGGVQAIIGEANGEKGSLANKMLGQVETEETESGKSDMVVTKANQRTMVESKL